MNLKDFREGLEILSRYWDKSDGYHLGAEHDTIYAYATDRPLSGEDIEKMIALGWHQEHNGRNYGEDFTAKDYRAEESWVAYI